MDNNSSKNQPHLNNNVLEFDGFCVLCNWAVNLVLRFDKREKIRIKVLSEDPNVKSDSLFFWKNGRRLDKSEAVFGIVEVLRGWFLVFYFFKIFPKEFNDGLYSWIARNRYSIFGKKQSCRIPTEKDKNRFIS